MSGPTTERVQLALRVSPDAKAAFEGAIHAERGCLRPYAGVTLEDELRARLDEGAIADLWNAVEDVAEALGSTPREKKTESVDRDGADTTVVNYRIAEDVRARVMDLAQESSWGSAGAFVEAVMLKYATDGSVIERLTDRLDRLDTGGDGDEDLSAKERRTNAIVDVVGGQGGFLLEDFDDAVDEAADGVSSGKYARQEYLPRVLDELGFTWHPNRPDLFIPREKAAEIGDHDVREKLYVLMSIEDRRQAIKLDAAERVFERGRERGQFTAEDALATLDGRPRRDTIHRLMREIAADSPGFQYDADKQRLKLAVDEIRRAGDVNADVLGQLDTEPPDGWPDEAAEMVPAALGADPPDEVLDNKIARAKYPDLVDDVTGPAEQALDRVTDADRERVRERLQAPLSGGPTPTAADTGSRTITADGGVGNETFHGVDDRHLEDPDEAG